MASRAKQLLTGSFGHFAPGQVISGVPESTVAAWVAAGVAEYDSEPPVPAPPEHDEPEMAVASAPEAAVVRRTSARAPRRAQKRRG